MRRFDVLLVMLFAFFACCGIASAQCRNGTCGSSRVFGRVWSPGVTYFSTIPAPTNANGFFTNGTNVWAPGEVRELGPDWQKVDGLYRNVAEGWECNPYTGEWRWLTAPTVFGGCDCGCAATGVCGCSDCPSR